MVTTENDQPPKLTASAADTKHVDMRPCLIHVPTGEMVKSYLELSKVVKKLGWKVFVDVSGEVWSAWYLPVGEESMIQMVHLPHPHIWMATYHQLSTLVYAFGLNTFAVTHAPLVKFRVFDGYADSKKPILRLKANGKQVFTVRYLEQILTQRGWKKEGEMRFVKQDTREIRTSPWKLVNVLKLPVVDQVQQLSTLDLEYITLVTKNIFYLQSPSRTRPPRTPEAKQQISPGTVATATA
ncbi:hypothetical protein R1sor_001374 [Riccia sorocarpa]|uniref:Uncharacterized protein n=1 Tax=Riccia sorocarpa TaxID=122646 RepID=A0ABD3GY83_9MARC